MFNRFLNWLFPRVCETCGVKSATHASRFEYVGIMRWSSIHQMYCDHWFCKGCGVS